jgi:hypothetical protein
MCVTSEAPFFAPSLNPANTASSRSGLWAGLELGNGALAKDLVITLRTPSTISRMSSLTEEFSIAVYSLSGHLYQVQAQALANHSQVKVRKSNIHFAQGNL